MKHLILLLLLIPSLSARASDASWEAFLKEIVEINSGSKNAEGLAQVKKVLTREFQELGFEVREIPTSDGKSNLSIAMKDASPTIGLYGHIDTVFGKDTDFKSFDATETELHGPGVIDMKGGVALIREIVRDLRQSRPDQLKKLKILINDDEELGSPASKLPLQKDSAGLQYGLVFEPGDDDGKVCGSLSGINWLQVEIQGKAAHAGLEHAKGKNACVELSKLLVDASKQTRYPRNFTVNVGTLEGGTTPNIVCEQARAKLDIRFVQESDLKKFKQLLEKRLASLPEGFKGELKTNVEVQSLAPAQTDRLFGEFKAAAKALKIPFERRHFGYASDANHLQNVPGLSLIVGIGPYGHGLHSKQETLRKSTFEERKKLVLQWLETK